MKADFLSNWKLRQVDAAGVAVVIIGLVALYLGGLRPILRAQDAAAARSSRISAQEENVHKLHEQAGRLKQRLAEVREAVRACPIRLESVRQVNGRIARLADLGAASGLKIDEINPDAGFPAGAFDLVPMRLFGSGSYRTWAAFLHELTGTFPDMCVDSFELTAGPDTDAPAGFRIRLLWCAFADRKIISRKSHLRFAPLPTVSSTSFTMKITKRQKLMIAVCAALAGFLVLDRVQSSNNPLSPDSAAGSPVSGDGTDLAGLSLPDDSQPLATLTPSGNPLAALIREVSGRRDVTQTAVRDAFQPAGPWRVAAPTVVEPRFAPSNTAAFIDSHKLTATLSGPSGGSAVINGRFCSVGEVIGGFRLVAVDERSATLESSHGTVKLLLSTASE